MLNLLTCCLFPQFTKLSTINVSNFAMIIFQVNCKWGSWSESTCDVTCGKGHKRKSREIVRHEEHGGRPCSGKSHSTTKCKLKACPGSPTIFKYLLRNIYRN